MTRRLVVVGSGIAGLYAALLAAEARDPSGAPVEVVLLSKGSLEESNTFYAQGGISAVLAPGEAAPGDSVASHIADTLGAGAGLNNPEAVRILCTEAAGDIRSLQRFGVHFDPGPSGTPALGLEAAHSAPRILHAGGDATGACISRGLIAAVLERAVAGLLRVESGAFVTDLTTAGGRVTGVAYLQGGKAKALEADAVLLATGGAGRLYARTTNPDVATADGLALAWRAGAAVSDLEFFQFHPTSMVLPDGAPGPLLVSEAVRGEGAVLVDSAGYRFMPDYHPDAELAPRDVVSRSIALHLARTGAAADSPVFLDARNIEESKGAGFLARRFPTITAATRAAGYDWTSEPLPVAPAAHYWMGGVATDLDGRTTVPGLFAAGEVACTGVQGANRLASNSLLEGLVFARRAVDAFRRDAGAVPGAAECRSELRPAAWTGPAAWTRPAVWTRPASWTRTAGHTAGGGSSTPGEPAVSSAPAAPPEFSRSALSRLMTSAAGVLRTGAELDAAAAQLAAWAAVLPPLQDPGAPEALVQCAHEDRNLLLAAQLLVQAARARPLSAGAHYRADQPASAEPQPSRNSGLRSMQRIS